MIINALQNTLADATANPLGRPALLLEKRVSDWHLRSGDQGAWISPTIFLVLQVRGSAPGLTAIDSQAFRTHRSFLCWTKVDQLLVILESLYRM